MGNTGISADICDVDSLSGSANMSGPPGHYPNDNKKEKSHRELMRNVKKYGVSGFKLPQHYEAKMMSNPQVDGLADDIEMIK